MNSSISQTAEVSAVCYVTRDFRISHIEVMSPALWFPFRGLTRLSHPGKTSRRVSAAKSIPDKSLNKTSDPGLDVGKRILN